MSVASTAIEPNGSAIDSAHVLLLRQAFEHHLPDLVCLDPVDILVVDVDMPRAVETVLGALPALRAFRADIVGLPGFDRSLFDAVEGYALAAAHAHGAWLTAQAPGDDLAILAAEATVVRDAIHAEALRLCGQGALSPHRIAGLRTPSGYRNLAFDLMGLAGALRQPLARLGTVTRLHPSSLDRAEALARRIVTAVGAREQVLVKVARAAEDRQRAFTLLARTYDQVRRAIAFLRWNEGDADRIAPSLYGDRPDRARGRSSSFPPASRRPSMRATAVVTDAE
jgi:hypothetical protein